MRLWFRACLASFLGAAISENWVLCGHYDIGAVPEFGLSGAVFAVVLGMLCACVGIFLCMILHQCGHLYRKYFPNPICGLWQVRDLYRSDPAVPVRLYNGSGAQIIERVFEGEAIPVYAFLLKILFTGGAWRRI